VIVPTRGDPARLTELLDALERQTLDRARWELIVACDTPAVGPAIDERLRRAGARVLPASQPRGPGAARNRAAAEARADVLAFTEDDCAPAPDWLERAALRLAADPSIEVLAGATVKPGGRPAHRQASEGPLYLPTNLFVRRARFERAGGFCEAFFDAENGIYFREDSDFGFTLEEQGARIASASDVVVEHPEEHAGFWDPVRWARRHEMDALLASRHPALFRERIEVHRIGPLRVRRPIVRACLAYLAAFGAAAITTLNGRLGLAAAFLTLALLALVPLWAKWRFELRRLPVLPIVPFVLGAALLRGQGRARAKT
jgi:glycosyltransferase involved in cell wall biosynthesis